MIPSSPTPRPGDDVPPTADPVDDVPAITGDRDAHAVGGWRVDPVAMAEYAVLLCGVDPARAWERARQALEMAATAGCLEAEVVARRALGLAARELGDLALAEEELRRSAAEARRLPRRAAQARLSLVTVRTELGHPVEALRIADTAEPYLCSVERAKLCSQRAVALMRLGRNDEAVLNCDHAVRVLTAITAEPDSPPLPLTYVPAQPGPDPRREWHEDLSRADDLRFLAGALLNRGLAAAYLADFERAEADLVACVELASEAGLGHVAALAKANMPFVAAKRGDIPAAFARYREAEEALFGYPERLATMRCDLADALVVAYLPGEARALLDLAVPELEAAGARGALAEARLLLAQLELQAGAPYQAAAAAELARADLTAQGRDAWIPLATEATLRARLATSPPSTGLLTDLIDCAEALSAGSWGTAAGALRLSAAELAIQLGLTDTAEGQLRLLTADRRGQSRHPDGGPIEQHAVALSCTLRGDLGGAFEAVGRGLAEVGASSVALTDPVTRAHAVKAGERLAALGVSLALQTGQGRTTLACAERWRAVAASGFPRAPDPGIVQDTLGEADLVEYVRHGDDLAAVVVTAHEITLHHLGPARTVAEAAVRLRYSMRRASLRDTPPHASPPVPGQPTGSGTGVLPEVAEAVRQEAAVVDSLLVAPLRHAFGPGPLVIVPAGSLHTMPWQALPSLAKRPVSVAASAAAWLSATRTSPRGTARPLAVAVVGGPGLAHGARETELVARRYDGARAVPARVSEVLRALDEVDIVHFAAHGSFNARSPLMSSIMLDDGPLMAYDLLTLRTPPRLVVLSACDSGMAHAPADGAPLGLAGTFLTKGTACVIAGMIPVRDEEAPVLMTEFHDLIAGGHTPAAALAVATARTGVAGFGCFGAGDQPVATGLSGEATQCDQDPT
ncbi:CHAT domain-containing protein [Streptosporangium sp. KLBMP 9127]|nr:CHAT domain-containing protein [Streptosporangium sp. KLBMP 9127]